MRFKKNAHLRTISRYGVYGALSGLVNNIVMVTFFDCYMSLLAYLRSMLMTAFKYNMPAL